VCGVGIEHSGLSEKISVVTQKSVARSAHES
jgi:hypothetical protein